MVMANFDGNFHGAVEFMAEAFAPRPLEETRISGVVLDNDLRAIPGVRLSLVGTPLSAVTDAEGRFLILNPPVGDGQLLDVDASGATLPGKYSDLAFEIDVLPGQDNQLPRPMFLPLLNEGIEVPMAFLDERTGEVLEERVFVMPTGPTLAPVTLRIPQGTRITFPPGAERKISVTRVPLNRVPMALEDGLFSQMYVSIQPEGAHFDPPLPISFPNVDGAAPGERVTLMSFVHDIGRFMEIGTATVSADGRAIESDPGVGIREADWHATPRRPTALVTTICGQQALPQGLTDDDLECNCWCTSQPANAMGNGVFCAGNVPVTSGNLSDFRFDEGAAAAQQELARRGGTASLECVCRIKLEVKITDPTANQPIAVNSPVRIKGTQKGATEVRVTAQGIPDQAAAINGQNWETGEVRFPDPGNVTITATARNAAGATKQDQIPVKIVKPDLQMQGLPEQTQPVPHEENPGAVVGFNSDDDNNNSTQDKDEAGGVAGENDLVPVTLRLDPGSVNKGTAKLEVANTGNGRVKVWTSATKGTEVALPKIWNLATESVPATLYVEGTQRSNAAGDVSLKLTYTDEKGGMADDTVKVSVAGVDLEIYRADSDPAGNPFGALVAEADEETTGSFTVANLNDTDGDGTVDRDDANVVAGATGRNELDLMRLILEKPVPDAGGGSVRLSVLSGDVQLWTNSTKGGRVPTPQTIALSGFVTDNDGDGNNDQEFWVEARSPSTSLRNIVLKCEYQPASAGSFVTEDRVKATAVWATITRTVTDDRTATEVDALLGADYTANGGGAKASVDRRDGTGVKRAAIPPFGMVPVQNVIVVEFTIMPGDISTVPAAHRPLFDASRKKEGTIFQWTGGAPAPNPVPLVPQRIFPAHDVANDDSHNGDETNEPTPNGHLWVMDAPSPGFVAGGVSTFRENFVEFLRVRFDGTDPRDNVASGSRCSDFQPWSSKTTNGLTNSPNEVLSRHVTFVQEPLHTAATTPTAYGTRHHAPMRGLALATSAGAENITVVLVDAEPFDDDELDQKAVAVVKSAGARVGDQVAYTAIGNYGSALNGTIVGPLGSSGETDPHLAHEISGNSDNSAGTNVVGAAFTQPAPTVPVMTLGAITTVTVMGARVEADSGAGGMQTVEVRIVDADGLSDDLLQRLSVSVPRQMTDEAGGAVNAIQGALTDGFNVTGRIASKADGTVIGPDGLSGETTAQIAYEVGDSADNSASTAAAGPVFTMIAPLIGVNPIPVGGTSPVVMNRIFKEATGAAGNEPVQVRIVDADTFGDTLLQTLNINIPRPAGCFPAALIGPGAASGTIANTNGIITAAGGSPSSGETAPQIAYETGDSSTNSPGVVVTAIQP